LLGERDRVFLEVHETERERREAQAELLRRMGKFGGVEHPQRQQVQQQPRKGRGFFFDDRASQYINVDYETGALVHMGVERC